MTGDTILNQTRASHCTIGSSVHAVQGLGDGGGGQRTMVQREQGTPMGDLTPCQQRGWGEPEASALEQRPPREILTQELVEGGTQTNTLFTEAGSFPGRSRSQARYWRVGSCCEGSQGSARVSQGPGCRPGVESILKCRPPGPRPMGPNPQSGDIKKVRKCKEGGTHLPAPWCHLEADGRYRIPGFPACNQTKRSHPD